ncbi:alpha/beta fold hydrolase [Thauera chlorobenzoica]|uniref:Alpha/beta hydrolase n=1 Tax=Thauera chlorobenzoica TaxID=96773 RepID=A0A1H5XW73_9RHOO|nr:alpha/beta fold hydrolase [Thauera chlorobenzoica]APR04332.1 alpha/beta hydrolase [Thauera chlorobenzoica]SEG16014.1 Pimeloyl-ACP methyl ester carboxylesterase [Thauera chlorobenzoica]
MSTLILLPGLLCDNAVWSAQCAALGTAVHCIVPAYGDCESLAGMARAVLAQAPDGPLALAGHSMGGRAALEVARQAPQRIARIALLDSGLEALAAGEPGAHERSQRLRLLQLARDAGMRAMGQEWARAMVHPARLDTPLFEAILDMIARSTPERFRAQITALLGRPDARPLFASLACPVMLICGRQDAWSPLARHAAMQALRPQARLVPIEDSGHMAPMEQPAAVTAALHAWLRQAD